MKHPSLFKPCGLLKYIFFTHHTALRWRILLVITLISLSMIDAISFLNGHTALANAPHREKIQELGNSTIFLPYINVYESGGGGAVADWPMNAANPERTSWSPEEVTGDLHVEWYRPIEAFIPQNSQIIASNGLLFVSTARGLITINAENGSLVWRYDTELPLGNSPSVVDGIVYVAGFDRKIHALNAHDGTHLWEFDQATAGYDTNPLVIDGRVFAGNRDGYMYVIGAHGTPDQGRLLWKYKTGGPIHISAAYKNGVIYFASNDNYAYALNAQQGTLIWKSDKLPGDGYHSFWPVVFRDHVIFSAASGYRASLRLGIGSVEINDVSYGKIFDLDRDSLWPNDPDGKLIGPQVSDQEWSNGYPIINVSRITEYYEDNPNPDTYLFKPWRRIMIAINQDTGQEYTFDSDNDGYQEYIPYTMWGTYSGNRYPPIVGPDDILYQGNIYINQYIPQGRVMGWNPNAPSLMSVLSGQGAIDEPQALSGGGNTIYRSLCNDRVGSWFNIEANQSSGTLWGYSNPLFEQAPGYDITWWLQDPASPDRLIGSYGNVNGLYHEHGNQPAIIPHQGRLFTHRSNSIIAYGSGASIGMLPVVPINQVDQQPSQIPDDEELRSRLEQEIQKIIDAGHLRPGYINNGQFSILAHLADYYDNPGDTLYTLALAYPHVSNGLKAGLKIYLENEFNTYFDPAMVAIIGWDTGASRESMPLPPEVDADTHNLRERSNADSRFSWVYPPNNFYAMWLYAQIFPEKAVRVYDLTKTRLQVPLPAEASTEYLTERPFELNAYIAGYIGFLNLQELAGKTNIDSQLRTEVINELNRIYQLRLDIFSQETPWINPTTVHKRHLNIARNFMMLVPEVGDYLNQTLYSEIAEAIRYYDFLAPYWFVSRYESVHDEGVIGNLYNYQAIFQAKALILKEPRSELQKYLDVPAFEQGDLFYIQNLIFTLESS